jgi:hypothetical protein
MKFQNSTDARHDSQGSEEQPLKEERAGHVGRGGQIGYRHAIAINGDVILTAYLARSVGLEPTSSPPRVNA